MRYRIRDSEASAVEMIGVGTRYGSEHHTERDAARSRAMATVEVGDVSSL